MSQTHLAGMVQSAHLRTTSSSSSSSRHSRRNRPYDEDEEEEEEEEDIDDIDMDEMEDEDEEEEIPLSVLVRPHDSSSHPARHHRAQQSFPPMPDLRFEQSYLHSISAAKTWWRVAWITIRDQIMMPLAQGVLYNIAILGWQHWNRHARLSGSSAGARARRWWYRVNKWPLPVPERTALKRS